MHVQLLLLAYGRVISRYVKASADSVFSRFLSNYFRFPTPKNSLVLPDV